VKFAKPENDDVLVVGRGSWREPRDGNFGNLEVAKTEERTGNRRRAFSSSLEECRKRPFPLKSSAEI
jgi:hypothetical protein